ncbi:uncharacterized protein LOC109826485 [Asparagus officinalis]|uniref:uncharacterized protein LOC109826485 n=1 Tax=Asparagus officinalis TaxID=4686 RepID=UPI00098E68ED|nr:uncharacterized protein LOC109826485 [Asparagus officinalis]
MLLNKFGNADNTKNMLTECCIGDKLQLSSVYKTLVQPANEVAWAKTIWDGFLYPKHSFLLWLACHARLLTKDRLCRMGILSTNQIQCVLCNGHQLETRDHISFECQFSAKIWNMLMDWLRYRWRSCVWRLILNWYSHNLRGQGPMQKLKRMCLSIAVYMIWKERNQRIFHAKERQPIQIFRDIKFVVFSKVQNDDIHVHMKEILESL